MRAASRIVVVTFALLSCSIAPLVAGGCVNTTPIVIADAAREAVDTGAADAGTSACQACLTSPVGCAPRVDACRADTKCSSAFTCALERSCFELGDISALISCGFPCATTAGIVNAGDPSLDLSFAIFTCAATSCAEQCRFRTSADPARD